MSYVYYRAGYVLKYKDLPGMRKFHAFFTAYSRDMMPVDRTGLIKFPICTKSLFPLPKMRTFTKTYEEICNERAQELLKRNDLIYVFWSGGVDSTCLLVSLLKQAVGVQKEQIVVLLSEGSITEYPLFYRNHIRGKLRCESAMLFPYILGTNRLLVTGEHNDQLFGSDIIADYINHTNFSWVISNYNRKQFSDFFTTKMDGASDTAAFYVDLFERLKEAAPIPLKTNYDLFWWINFTLKWQTVYTRMLGFTARRNVGNITEEYIQNYYQPFFNTEDFQLWAMNNLDKRIKDDWRSYKWPAKEVIYNFTKDADYYENKIKRGSLQYILLFYTPFDFIDEKLGFHVDLEPALFYRAQNDFV